MPHININHGLKTPNWVYAHGNMFNGCSGYSYRLSPCPDGPDTAFGFDRPIHENFWDFLMGGGSGEYGNGKPGTNRRLKVLYLDPEIRLPSPNVHFKPPPDFAAYYLKAGDEIRAVLGTAKPEHFDHPNTPPATFLSDPEQYVSLAHLEAAGMYNRKNVYPKRDKSGYAVKVGGTDQLRFEGSSSWGNHALDPAGNLAHEWSRELSWMLDLPWWELCRLANKKYPNSKEMVQGIAKHVSTLNTPRTLWHVSGNANVKGPMDSFRAVFCFHALNPAATFDLAATPAVVTPDGNHTLYYKVLPFYYHSPQHADHRVATVFLSKEPIHLERIS